MNIMRDIRSRWHIVDTEDAYLLAGSGPGGLSSSIAAERLKKYGPNIITRGKVVLYHAGNSVHESYSIEDWFEK
jgi:hypothetical protein